jgi:hypothetical protein
VKHKLTSGAEIELVSPAELQAILDRKFPERLAPQIMRPVGGIALDGSGNSVTAKAIYEVPAGHRFRLHRAVFAPDGSTFGAPYTSNTGYLEIQRAGAMQDGIPFTSPGLPRIWTGGTTDGIQYEENETVDIFVVTGPASKSLVVRLQGTLEPHARQ